jgi:L-malate glycosyltransferase
MKIMEIVSGTRVNGAILHCLLLSRELVRRGHQVTLVCRPGSWISRQMVDGPIDCVRSDLHRWPPDELRRIAGIIRQRQIEVVHTHTSRANFFGILLRWMTGVPNVATAHTRHVQLHWMFSKRVIAVSESDRRYQRTHNFVRGSRIDTVHNFIDCQHILEMPTDARGRVRAWLGVADRDVLLGIVGSIVPRKGLIYLIRALPKVLASVPHARLVVIGGDTQGDYAVQARSTARKLGVASRISWTGPRNNVHELLAGLDIYVLPSLNESFPLSILEAMAAGLPVVATPVGGVPECIVTGQTGLLVPPANSDALAEAIIDLATAPQHRKELGEAGRGNVLQEFTAESQAPRIEAILARVVRRHAA